jgi:hypothetical protein
MAYRSGINWFHYAEANYPGYKGDDAIKHLDPKFGQQVSQFIDALRRNSKGAAVTHTIFSTYRPPERQYLMHYAWAITYPNGDPDVKKASDVPPFATWRNGLSDALLPRLSKLSSYRKLPALPPLSIRWDLGNEGDSQAQAEEMNRLFNPGGYGPGLYSDHCFGVAIDMTFQWSGTIAVGLGPHRIENTKKTVHLRNIQGRLFVDVEPPGNPDHNDALKFLGATYGVHKFVGQKHHDLEHWFFDGH